jgi:tetratricopeptide (TPR) repeat protein
MTLGEARRILGLGPDEDPRPLLPGLRANREALAAMVREAPNDDLALRHQDALVAFDRALATVRETLEALGLQEPPPAIENPEPDIEDDEPEEPRSSGWKFAAVMFLLLLLGTGGSGWLYWKYQDHQMIRFERKIASLDAVGKSHLENRRWDEARATFEEIERLLPGSPRAKVGRERIDAGIAEEHSQFIGYWTGEARAALDSGRWDDAAAAARTVLERFPTQPDATAVLDGIASAQLAETRRREIESIAAMLDEGRLDEADAAANALILTHPKDPEIAELASRARTDLDRQRADHARALDLFAKARDRDTGAFDAEALEWLREASLLAPHDSSIAALLEKMASYTRTIRLSPDADLDEILAAARENDRIVLPAGTWRGTFIINKPIELQGAGPGETFLECNAIAGCALTLGPGATGARVTGIAFRHIGFDEGVDRYSAALVRSGSATFTDCHFLNASGHGLAAIEGGRAELQRCRIAGNGWNGIAASGPGSAVTVADSQISGNFSHGAEVWEGAALVLTGCRIDGNTGNGAHLDTTATGVRIESCELTANREYGIVATATGADARIARNRVTRNQLGGIAVRSPAAATVAENEISSNTGPGIVTEEGIDTRAWLGNQLQRNADDRIITRPNLAPTDPP